MRKLCAQDLPYDCPTLLNIVAMLDGEIAAIPTTKESSLYEFKFGFG